LERLLRDSGVRVIIRELQNAPQLLQAWDLIEPAEGGYCFRVELLRQWLVKNKPLRRVQEELGRTEPVAESLYQAAVSLYRSRQLEQAIEPLRQAINLNPNHLQANELLVDILVAQGELTEARQFLESLYQYYPVAARPRLIQVVSLQAEKAGTLDEQLDLYNWLLKLEENQPDPALLNKIEQLTSLTQVRVIWYKQALEALQTRELENGKELLAKVVSIDPDYREAAFLLMNVSHINLRRLSPLNPLDYLRLLWWWFITPQQFKVHQEIFGKKHLYQLGVWLSITLFWLPLFLPTLALGLGLLPRTETAWSAITYLRLSGGMALVWFLESFLGSVVESFSVAVAGVVAARVAGAVAFVVVGVVAGVVAIVVVLGVAGGVVGGWTVVLAGGVAGGLVHAFVNRETAGDVVFSMVGLILLTMLPLAFVVACGVAGGQWGGLIFVGAFVIALRTVNESNDSLETGRPSWRARGALVVLLLAHAFIIWFSFLGGWQVFA
jgi:tetratricopeptide (TPR) repeat protein